MTFDSRCKSDDVIKIDRERLGLLDTSWRFLIHGTRAGKLVCNSIMRCGVVQGDEERTRRVKVNEMNLLPRRFKEFVYVFGGKVCCDEMPCTAIFLMLQNGQHKSYDDPA